MARALLLGGAGFIGTHLAATLQQQGTTPIIWDPRPPMDASLDHYPQNVTALAQGVGDSILTEVETLYYLAWTTIPATADANPVQDMRENVLPGLELLTHLSTLKQRPRLIFISTGGAIYGIPQTTPMTESHPTCPIGAYGIGKLTLEHYLAQYGHRHGLDYLIFRPGNPYGGHQQPGRGQGVITEFLQRILQNRPIEIWGNGEVIRDFLHIDDLVAALSLGMTYAPNPSNQRIFNVGSGVGISLNTLLRTLESITQRQTEVIYRPSRGVDVPAVVLSIERIHTAMGWEPTITLEEGLRRAWHHLNQTR